jgi:hypothetical protein
MGGKFLPDNSPCKHCGSERRRTSAGILFCDKCNFRRTREWALNNPERAFSKKKEYSDRNRDVLRRKEKERRASHWEEVYKKQKEWRDAQGYLYRKWTSINQRCHNPKSKSYKDYGGRGITVFAGWRIISEKNRESIKRNKESFENFRDYIIKEIGHRPDKSYTLDRVNNHLGYVPGNIRWATAKVQANNRRSSLGSFLPDDSPIYTKEGELITIREFSERMDIPLVVVKYRYTQNWDADWIISYDYDNRNYEWNGKNYNLNELCLLSGLNKGTLQYRLFKLKWSVEKAINTPVQEKI